MPMGVLALRVRSHGAYFTHSLNAACKDLILEMIPEPLKSPDSRGYEFTPKYINPDEVLQ